MKEHPGGRLIAAEGPGRPAADPRAGDGTATSTGSEPRAGGTKAGTTGSDPVPAPAVTRPTRGRGPVGRTAHARLRDRPLVVWAVLIMVAFAVGAVLGAAGALPIDHLPPLHGHLRVPGAGLLPAAGFAVLVVAALPDLVARSRFGVAVLVAYGVALAWAVLLALSGSGVAEPFTHPQEYLAVLPAVGDDPAGWLRAFTDRLPGYPTHVRGHPPLPVLIVWALAAVGLPGPLWAALLVIAAGCSAVVAVALTVRRLAGEAAARRALPYLALTPAAVWIATSMDALFAGAGAWGVALLVMSAGGGLVVDRQRRSPGAAQEGEARHRPGHGGPQPRGQVITAKSLGEQGILAGSVRGQGILAKGLGGQGIVAGGLGGLVLGALPYLSYGLVPYLLVAGVAGVVARVPVRAVIACLGGAGAVTGAFALGGFWWPDGVAATHAEWAADPGAARPYLYFLIANLAVLALLTGPAAAIGLVRLPAGPLRAVIAAAVVAVVALDVSGVTRGEVERIWLPFATWIGLASAWSPVGRRWLAVQALTGLLLQGLVLSPW